MGLKTKKLELIKLISNIDNDELIAGISDYLKANMNDWWNDLSQAEKDEIELGIKQLDEGKGISFDDYWRKVS